MKKESFPVLILLLVSFLVMSCTSLSLEMKAQNEGLPLWVYSYENPYSRVSFVGSGTDSDSYKARLRAYMDVADQVGSYLGAPITDDQYRELTTLSTIKDYSLSISDRAEKQNPDSSVTVYVLALASETKLQSGRSQVSAERDNLILEINRKLEEAQALYEGDQDTKAVICYLDAARMAKENSIEMDIDEMITKACNLINKIDLIIEDSNPDLCRLSFLVQRSNRFFPSPINGAIVKSKISAVQLNGEEYTDEFLFSTGKDGRFWFLSPNSGLKSDGVVEFSLDLGESLELFYSVMDLGQGQRVKDEVSKKTVNFEYHLSSEYALSRIALCVIEFDILGDVSSSFETISYSAQLLMDMLEADGIPVTGFVSTIGEDDEALLQDLEVSSYDYLILGKVGVAELHKGNTTNVLLNGSVQLIELADNSVIYDSEDVQTVGTSLTQEESIKEALKLYADIVHSQLRDRMFFL